MSIRETYISNSQMYTSRLGKISKKVQALNFLMLNALTEIVRQTAPTIIIESVTSHRLIQKNCRAFLGTIPHRETECLTDSGEDFLVAEPGTDPGVSGL